jgi:hypothetical protein
MVEGVAGLPDGEQTVLDDPALRLRLQRVEG